MVQYAQLTFNIHKFASHQGWSVTKWWYSAGQYFNIIKIMRYGKNIEYPIMISWFSRYIAETRYDQNTLGHQHLESLNEVA